MLIELSRQLKAMVSPGDTLICAVSGGADSVALLFGAFLLKEKLGFSLEAAHYNHGLRGEESDGDEAFVAALCDRFGIPLHVGRGHVVAGKKGLEAAAREARYGFFAALEGKIATAHTADDNAETVLLHLVRGTGLKGLGGIAPVRGNLLRPMLNITRQQVIAFLDEYHLQYRTDSSNEGDAFLRNRLRHHVMPLLTEENPRLAENLSAMAQRLRLDEEVLAAAADYEELPDVDALRRLSPVIRGRMLERFLKENGVPEPEAEHIALAESLVFSEKPSARGDFPGGVTIAREYEKLVAKHPSVTGVHIRITEAETIENSPHCFTVWPQGEIRVRTRQAGDEIRLAGGTRSLKKLFIDRKIPAHLRDQIPVVVDDRGILGVYSIGTNLDRAAQELPAVRIQIEKREE